MEYVYTNDSVKIVDYISGLLLEHIVARQKVVWLLSGGSAIGIAVAVAEKLGGQNLTNLSITMGDERFGAVGHENENWQQLLDMGFSVQGADIYRPLIGQDRHTTSEALGVWLDQRITAADFSIGLFGMGADGHTAGIKPGSAAVTAMGWTVDYTNDDFERITMTPPAIMQLDVAVLQAMGADKAEAIDRLLHTDTPISEEPVQILKQVKKSILFTDYKEGEL